MKRAKWMLAAILLLVGLGAALAFKAATRKPYICTATQRIGDNVCRLAVHGRITTQLVPGDMVVYYTTDEVPGDTPEEANAFCTTRSCDDFIAFIHFDD